MIFDSHIHGTCSTDSKMTWEEATQKADSNGIGIIFTEHMDYNCYKDGSFTFDINDYFNKLNKYRSDSLLIGIELGMTDEASEYNEKIIKENNFDYVIGSVHFLRGKDIYYEDTYEGLNKTQSYDLYLKYILNNLNTHKYIDTLGHIDYICRYAPFKDTEMYFEEFKENIEPVLKKVIENDIVLELNTRRLTQKSKIDNLIKIYSFYKELGGKLVTIGSDAHDVDTIGANFNAAYDICNVCNLKPVYFKNRICEYMNLK
jgi:histidinol-phosphatase (PHP family)